MIVLCIITHSV